MLLEKKDGSQSQTDTSVPSANLTSSGRLPDVYHQYSGNFLDDELTGVCHVYVLPDGTRRTDIIGDYMGDGWVTLLEYPTYIFFVRNFKDYQPGVSKYCGKFGTDGSLVYVWAEYPDEEQAIFGTDPGGPVVYVDFWEFLEVALTVLTQG